jgi:hypothetical protein
MAVQVAPKKTSLARAVDKFGAYFEERGLGPRDIPAAIVVHELLGMCIATAAWMVRQLAGHLGRHPRPRGWHAPAAEMPGEPTPLWMARLPPSPPRRATPSSRPRRLPRPP